MDHMEQFIILFSTVLGDTFTLFCEIVIGDYFRVAFALDGWKMKLLPAISSVSFYIICLNFNVTCITCTGWMIHVGHFLRILLICLYIFAYLLATATLISKKSEMFILYTRSIVILSAGDLFKVRRKLQFVTRPEGAVRFACIAEIWIMQKYRSRFNKESLGNLRSHQESFGAKCYIFSFTNFKLSQDKEFLEHNVLFHCC